MAAEGAAARALLASEERFAVLWAPIGEAQLHKALTPPATHNAKAATARVRRAAPSTPRRRESRACERLSEVGLSIMRGIVDSSVTRAVTRAVPRAVTVRQPRVGCLKTKAGV